MWRYYLTSIFQNYLTPSMASNMDETLDFIFSKSPSVGFVPPLTNFYDRVQGCLNLRVSRTLQKTMSEKKGFFLLISFYPIFCGVHGTLLNLLFQNYSKFSWILWTSTWIRLCPIERFPQSPSQSFYSKSSDEASETFGSS